MSNININGSKKGQKLVVVGGVAGGASFAARARRLDESAEIVLLQVSCRSPMRRSDLIDMFISNHMPHMYLIISTCR